MICTFYHFFNIYKNDRLWPGASRYKTSEYKKVCLFNTRKKY